MKLYVLAVVACSFAFATAALAADPKPTGTTVDEKAQKSRGSGADPNIKKTSDKNDTKAKAPDAKGKKRGGGPNECGIHFDNQTNLKIRIFVDGNLEGLLMPWGDAGFVTGNGTTVVYGQAVFDDGDSLIWGPHVFKCPSGAVHTWRLTND